MNHKLLGMRLPAAASHHSETPSMAAAFPCDSVEFIGQFPTKLVNSGNILLTP